MACALILGQVIKSLGKSKIRRCCNPIWQIGLQRRFKSPGELDIRRCCNPIYQIGLHGASNAYEGDF